jgi:nucleotide-binding universal stress UspA family protein
MHIILGVTESDAALNAFNWIKRNPLHLWNELNLTIVHVIDKQAGAGVALLRKYELLARNFAKTVSTKLLPRQKSVGQTLKEFVGSIENPLLVIGARLHKWKTIDYCVQRCECPVMVVKREHSAPPHERPCVALAMDVNVHCDRTFTWWLQHSALPDVSQLYVVHITPKKSDKPDARKFLASLKPKCMESKRMYSMASALVSYDRGGIADGIIKFCHDKDVQTLVISSKGDRQLSRLRLTYSITDECLRNSTLDCMVWMDGQTRNVSASRYIWNFQDVPPPMGLAYNNDSTQLHHANPCFDDENEDEDENDETNSKLKASKISGDNEETKSSNEQKKTKNETKSKKPIPHQPSYPRPQADVYRPYEEPPLAPISESTIHVPISDLSATKKQRRKNSLKYYMYDQIAKGKKSLGWDGVHMEPLSP